MLRREQWLDAARKLDWEYSYVKEEDVFPRDMSGRPWLSHEDWKDWDEPFRTSSAEYVENQSDKDTAMFAVRDALGRAADYDKLDPGWLNALKLHKIGRASCRERV